VELILECELGYTFDPAVWGQGYANEAAQGVRDYARDGLARLRGFACLQRYFRADGER